MENNKQLTLKQTLKIMEEENLLINRVLEKSIEFKHEDSELIKVI